MLETLIAKHGLLAVLIGAGIEGGDGGVFGGVSAHRHLLPFWVVAAAATIGSFVADQIFFFLGRRASSLGFVQRLTSHAVAARGNALMERYPTGFILAGATAFSPTNLRADTADRPMMTGPTVRCMGCC